MGSLGTRPADSPQRRLQLVVGVIDFLKPEGRMEQEVMKWASKDYLYSQKKFEDYAYFSFCTAGLLFDSVGNEKQHCSDADFPDGIDWASPRNLDSELCTVIRSCRGLGRQDSTHKPRSFSNIQACKAKPSAANR